MNCLVCGKELIGQQRKYCSRRCERIAFHRKSRGQAIDVRPRRSHLEWSDEDIQNRINTKSSKIIYCGGYSNSKSPMYVYCDDCGQPFKWNAKGLRERDTIRCGNCRKILSDIKQREHQKLILNNLAIRREQTIHLQNQREAEKIKAKNKRCRFCDNRFFANGKSIFCSDVCRKKYNNRIRDIRRRILIKENLIDKDISLEKLAKRDKDICWICQKKVDWNDFEIRNDGVFVAGKKYPSIDHVIALTNGGKHSWDNVRLTHRMCNTEKRNNIIGQKQNGQLVIFL